MALIDTAMESLRSAFSSSLDFFTVGFVELIFGMLIAILVLVVGWIFSRVVAKVLKHLLVFIKLEEFLKAHKMADALGDVQISNVLVKLSKYYIILIFLQAAIAQVGLGTITLFLSDLLAYVPSIYGAIVLLIVAALFAELVKEKTLEMGKKSKLIRMSAMWIKLIIIFLALITGLSTIGFDTSIIERSFVTLLQAIAFGVAAAFAIAFGLGGQEDARSIIKNLRSKLKY